MSDVCSSDLAVAEQHAVLRGLHAFGAGTLERDVLFRQVDRRRELDLVRLAPTHRHPRVRRGEREPVLFADHGDCRAAAKRVAEFVGDAHAAQPRADDDDLNHGRPPAGTAPDGLAVKLARTYRSEEHTSELQSLMRISYAVFCLNKKKYNGYNLTDAN